MSELVFSAFIAGLLGGVHCVAMCGGIVGALNFHPRTPAFTIAMSASTRSPCGVQHRTDR
jgi:sulfite exporter TauE/SafE